MQKKEVYYTIVVTRKRKKREIYNWVFHSSIVVNTLCVLFHSLLYDICLFLAFSLLQLYDVRVFRTGQGRGFSLSDTVQERGERVHSLWKRLQWSDTNRRVNTTKLYTTRPYKLSELTQSPLLLLLTYYMVPQILPNSVHLNWGIAPVTVSWPRCPGPYCTTSMCCTWYLVKRRKNRVVLPDKLEPG